MNTKNKMVVCFILDRSGSMAGRESAVISGFKEYINGLKRAKHSKNTLFSLVTFDTEGVDTLYDMSNLSKVKPLTRDDYIPRAGTPLYDTAVDTIEKLAKKVNNDQPVLVVIMTDGEENSSTKHDEKCFRDLVKKLEKRGNWTFAYMGANQDTWANAQKYGLSIGNSLSWNSSLKGTQAAFSSLTNASVNMLASVADSNVRNVNNFFEKEVATNDSH